VRVLVIGNGAREHAIAWKVRQSPVLSELLVAPGNAGTAQIAENVPINAGDIGPLLDFARQERIDLTVVGPEAPLAAGIADRFQEAGLRVFGPTKAAARVESSKSFAKELMLRHRIPTGIADVFDDYDQARRHLEGCPLPVVVKADGLAAGKGVTVARSRKAALDAIRVSMVDKRFGAAGERVLIEECLEGKELSVFAFVDGERVSSLVAARDYKPVGDGDRGPNTGGMGAYSPVTEPLWDASVEHEVRDRIMEPVVAALAEDGAPYRGALYAGLMLTAEGPKVVEFNCRLGDPEAQAVLPRLKTDLLEVMIGTAQGDLGGVSLEWDRRACVGVVIASGGYPGSYMTGFPVRGLDTVDGDVTVFHGGTKMAGSAQDKRVLTDGGRVFTVVAQGETLEAAKSKAYSNAGRISFEGSFYRKDIAAL
jgi:phosphoribosylamine--glycine ligase